MNKVNIVRVPGYEDKYKLYIDDEEKCIGNLASVVAVLNVNLGLYDKYLNKVNINEEK